MCSLLVHISAQSRKSDPNGAFIPFLALEVPLSHAVFCHRLLEFATSYFDLKQFPDGETKRALERIIKKKLGKTGGPNGDGGRDRKRRKV